MCAAWRGRGPERRNSFRGRPDPTASRPSDPVATDYPRGGRGGAATRRHGLSARPVTERSVPTQAPPSAAALDWPSELWEDPDELKRRCDVARKGGDDAKGRRKAEVARLAGGDSGRAAARKLRTLGMLDDGAAATENARGERRELARTRYMDNASGASLGTPWPGPERLGAAADVVSRRVRDALAAAPALCPAWRPNPAPFDPKWGGPAGKPCAHNEVVMHAVRPFVAAPRGNRPPGLDGPDFRRDFDEVSTLCIGRGVLSA